MLAGRQRLRNKLDELARRGVRRVGLYGAGEHTQAASDVLRRSPVPVVAVLDDDARRCGQQCAGLPIVTPAAARSLDLDAVVISTDEYERQIWKRRGALTAAGIDVHRLYPELSGWSFSPANLRGVWRRWSAAYVRSMRQREQRRAKARLDRRGWLDSLAARPADAFAPDYADLWFLYTTVRRRRPRVVLEFGSGCSTVMIARALWDNVNGRHTDARLVTVEADARWAEVTRGTLPAHLRAMTDIFVAPAIEDTFAGAPVLRHERLPDVTPDFIYLDGPALSAARPAAIDVLALEPRFPRGFFMVVDGRAENVALLRRALRRQYAVRTNHGLQNTTFALLG
ncbi:MAG: hypothetical protein AB7Q17_04065 [Phycisphaerae bacterium]